MEVRRYDPFSQALHWLIAVVILATYLIAIVRDEARVMRPAAGICDSIN